MLITKLIWALFFALFPVVILFLCKRINWLNQIGSVVLAYGIGLIISNIHVLPQGIEPVQDLIMSITIPLALPLLLFSVDIKQWMALAGKTFQSMVLSILAMMLVLLVGYTFKDKIPMAAEVTGMLAGVYTGGTANMAALAVALHVDQSMFIMVNISDIVISAIYLIFLMTAAQRLFLRFLPAFAFANSNSATKHDTKALEEQDFPSIQEFLKPSALFDTAKALGISVCIAGVGVSIGFSVPKSIMMASIILIISTLGILVSLIPSIKKIRYAFPTGMYLILVFSLTVSSMADVSKFAGISIYLILFVVWAIFGTLLLHLVLARIFRIDADTLIITSLALINSAPFVPSVAAAIKNKEIIVSGLTVGIIGYSIGTYVGIFLTWFLKWL